MATEGFSYESIARRIASRIVRVPEVDVTDDTIASIRFTLTTRTHTGRSFVQVADWKQWESFTPDELAELDALVTLYNASATVVSRAGQGMQHGIYDHFKGGVYRTLDVVPWAGDQGWDVVQYLSMNYGTLHTRFAHEWNEIVRWPDGVYRSRFVLRGCDLRVPPPMWKVPKEHLV